MTTSSPSLSRPPERPLALAAAVVLVGVGAGLAGMALGLLLHAVQHLAYGYGGLGHESFLQGASAAPPWRRAAALMLAGVVAGVGWWALRRYGRGLVSVRDAVGVQGAGQAMPPASTLVHVLLQIVTVGLGSPLGREVAPREAGALWADGVARWMRLPAAQRRALVACGAGAGLAAVYNVPLAGALFVLEVLLGTFDRGLAVMALASSAIAAAVAWLGLGVQQQYTLGPVVLDWPLAIAACIAGPLFGLAGEAFARATSAARSAAPGGAALPALVLLNFAGIACLAAVLPALLGNGKGPVQLSLAASLPLGMAVLLLGLRVLITVSTLRAGAQGGLLTPGLAVGALLALVLAQCADTWSATSWLDPAAFALVGATAFLAVSMQMPLTALVLMLEFTHAPLQMLVPQALAVAGATAAARWRAQRRADAAARRNVAQVPGKR
ncbi:chloride channel protein [Pseudomonadota bacterium AL_CKDN230030165-1A_HGKHYDSX7]